jgi:hypothetical protein
MYLRSRRASSDWRLGAVRARSMTSFLESSLVSSFLFAEMERKNKITLKKKCRKKIWITRPVPDLDLKLGQRIKGERKTQEGEKEETFPLSLFILIVLLFKFV